MSRLTDDGLRIPSLSAMDVWRRRHLDVRGPLWWRSTDTHWPIVRAPIARHQPLEAAVRGRRGHAAHDAMWSPGGRIDMSRALRIVFWLRLRSLVANLFCRTLAKEDDTVTLPAGSIGPVPLMGCLRP